MQSQLAALALLMFWFGVELAGRAKHGIRPSRFGQIFALLVGKGAYREQTGLRALLFSLFCFLAFALWESFLWMLFGHEATVFEEFLSVAGVGAAVKGLFDVFRRYYWREGLSGDAGESARSLAWFLGGVALLLGAWVSLALLGPWVALRFRGRTMSKVRRSGAPP